MCDVVIVNTKHVKKIKELDDNNQTKTDKKDASCLTLNLLEGEYEELRNANNSRHMIIKDLNCGKNQIHTWLDGCFPEYKEAYVVWESKSFIKIIKRYTFLSEIEKMSPNQIYGMLPTK